MSRAQPPSTSQDTIAIPRSSHANSTARYDESDRSRLELEDVKRENEALKRRIRELETSLNSPQPESDQSRSGLASTGATITPATGRDRPGDNDDDGVGMGESAASAGIGGGH